MPPDWWGSIPWRWEGDVDYEKDAVAGEALEDVAEVLPVGQVRDLRGRDTLLRRIGRHHVEDGLAGVQAQEMFGQKLGAPGARGP